MNIITGCSIPPTPYTVLMFKLLHASGFGDTYTTEGSHLLLMDCRKIDEFSGHMKYFIHGLILCEMTIGPEIGVSTFINSSW